MAKTVSKPKANAKKAPAKKKSTPAPKVHVYVKEPPEGTYWKSPLHMHQGHLPVTGLVLSEHVESINTRYRSVGHPHDQEVMDLTPGKGWTLDFDPVAKRMELVRKKMNSRLGLKS